MCQNAMIYSWYMDNGMPVNQMCYCINGKTVMAKDFDPKDAFIRHYQSREHAKLAGWKYDKNNKWTCPDCVVSE